MELRSNPMNRLSDVHLRKWIADNSGSWTLIESYLKDELDDAYKALANVDTTALKTEQLRGKAAFILKLLNLKTLPLVIDLTQ